MFKAMLNIIAEIVVGIIWCFIMVTGAVLVFLIALGILGAFVGR